MKYWPISRIDRWLKVGKRVTGRLSAQPAFARKGISQSHSRKLLREWLDKPGRFPTERL